METKYFTDSENVFVEVSGIGFSANSGIIGNELKEITKKDAENVALKAKELRNEYFQKSLDAISNEKELAIEKREAVLKKLAEATGLDLDELKEIL